jgi:hypothetical protein
VKDKAASVTAMKAYRESRAIAMKVTAHPLLMPRLKNLGIRRG